MAIDLGGNTPPALPLIAAAPLGIDLAGSTNSGGAGFSVSDVGDVNGDGYDDFVVGAPTVVNQGGQIAPGSGNTATAYLIFGSKTTNSGAISNWLNNNPDQRVGDLSQLGNTPTGQQNPINGVAGFPFAGIKFITSQTPGSQLGVSAAAAGTIHGVPAFLLGAPGETDVNGTNPGTGRAYLVYGGSALNNVSNTTVDLDSNLQNSGLTIVTFANSNPGARTGRSVAGVGDVITDGFNDIAVGAPNATVNGLGNAGDVYLISGAGVPTTTLTVNLALLGQGVTGSFPGFQLTGAGSGDLAGFSVAGAGNVDGATTSANQSIQDLLIGAPQTNAGPGAAFLVYGGFNLGSFTVVNNGLRQIPLASVGGTGTGGVPGLRVNGSAVGDQTGWSVSSAGDFNGDGLQDVLIGSPGYLAGTGRADIFYGLPVSAPLQGTVTLGQAASNVLSAGLIGAGVGDLAGYAVGYVGNINTALAGNPILIGSPGFNGGSGTAYLIPQNPFLIGSNSLGSATGPTLAATQFTLSNPSSLTPSFFGASVSGHLTQSGSLTADGDTRADFIIGAPGYAATSTRTFAGGAFILEGAFVLPFLQIPVNNTIATTIGVGAPPPGPFNVNATTPAALQIFVLSNAAANFDPVTDINPATIVVNGVAFPNATIAKDPVDENKDGIEDAIITIQPRSNLNLPNGTSTLTIIGRTLASSPIPNKVFVGSATINVTGGTTGGGGGGGGGGAAGGPAAVPIGQVFPTRFIPPLGPDTYVPQITVLSRLGSYKPIPLRVAINQFLVQPGFSQRLYNFAHPGRHVKPVTQDSLSLFDGRSNYSVSRNIHTREKFTHGKHYTFTHKVRVIPVNLQTERV